MRRIVKILKWCSVGIGLLVLIFVLSVSIYLEQSGEKFLNENEWRKFESLISEAPYLPNKFYEKYEALYPAAFDQGLKSSLIQQLLGKPTKCPCANVARMATYGSFINGTDWEKFMDMKIALELEDRVTQKKCFDYMMMHYDFINNSIGVENAAQVYYKKEVLDLTETEVLELLIMSENPSLYNPFKRKELLDKRVQEIKDEMKNGA